MSQSCLGCLIASSILAICRGQLQMSAYTESTCTSSYTNVMSFDTTPTLLSNCNQMYLGGSAQVVCNGNETVFNIYSDISCMFLDARWIFTGVEFQSFVQRTCTWASKSSSYLKLTILSNYEPSMPECVALPNGVATYNDDPSLNFCEGINSTQSDHICYSTSVVFQPPGGKEIIIGLPDSAKKLIVYEPASNSVRLFDDGNGDFVGTEMWKTSGVVNGKVYGLPYSAGSLLIFDPVAGSLQLKADSRLFGNKMWRASGVVGSKVVGFPYNADYFVWYDATATSFKFPKCSTAQSANPSDPEECGWAPSPSPADKGCCTHVGGKSEVFHSVAVVGSLVIGMPYYYNMNSAEIGVYDFSQPTPSYTTVTTTSAIGTGNYYASPPLYLQSSNKLVAFPWDNDRVVVMDALTAVQLNVMESKYSWSSSEYGWLSDSGEMWGSGVVAGDVAIGLPYKAEAIAIFNDSKPAGSQLRQITNPAFQGTKKWICAAYVPQSGKVIGFPDEKNSILVYDIGNDMVTFNEDNPSWHSWRTCDVIGSKVYGLPTTTGKILIYDTDPHGHPPSDLTQYAPVPTPPGTCSCPTPMPGPLARPIDGYFNVSGYSCRGLSYFSRLEDAQVACNNNQLCAGIHIPECASAIFATCENPKWACHSRDCISLKAS